MSATDRKAMRADELKREEIMKVLLTTSGLQTQNFHYCYFLFIFIQFIIHTFFLISVNP